MSINKINLDGTEYPLNQAKLVATGEWDNENVSFIIEKKLENNKFYFVKCISSFGYNFSSIILVQNDFSTDSPIVLRDASDDNIIIGNIISNYYLAEKITKIAVLSNSETIFTNDSNATCEVYELPITLGGNE